MTVQIGTQLFATAAAKMAHTSFAYRLVKVHMKKPGFVACAVQRLRCILFGGAVPNIGRLGGEYCWLRAEEDAASKHRMGSANRPQGA